MIHPLLFGLLPAALGAALLLPDMSAAARCAAPDAPQQHTAATLEEAYRGGQTWDAWLAGVESRRAQWSDNWASATVPDTLVARARAAGAWRILVITEARCSDSVSSVPFLARLVQAAPALEMRLVNSTVGRPWMELHRTPDGRAATPTVLVLDERYRIRGCWVEQPAALQAVWLPIVASGTMSREIDTKMSWYTADGGREILRELVDILEAARGNQPICPGLSARP